MIGIYKVTNPDGLVYIGQSLSLEKRMKSYRYFYPYTAKKLQASFEKYGIDARKVEIIQECEADELSELEQFYSELYDSIDNGLNSVANFHGQRSMDDGHKKKISDAAMGRVVSEETRAKISSTLMGNIPWNKGTKGLTTAWNKGVPQSEEVKKKLSEHWTGKTGSEAVAGKYLYQFDLQCNVLAIWVNAREVHRELGFSWSVVNRAARGERKQAYGFKWSYNGVI